MGRWVKLWVGLWVCMLPHVWRPSLELDEAPGLVVRWQAGRQAGKKGQRLTMPAVFFFHRPRC